MSMFRDVVAQWEKLANQYGSQLLVRPEAAHTMHSVVSTGLQVQSAVQDAMAKVLAAANMPSKAEVAAIGERLSAIEAILARLELQSPPASSDVSRPSRGRKPSSPA